MSNAAAVFGDTPDTLEPVTGGNRLANLDLIRGIAVLGILAANIVFFGQPMMAYMWPEGFVSEAGDPDYWMWIAQYVLIDGKMRGLFTLLFGVGLVLFVEKAWARGSGRWLLARRLFWLLLFGYAHFLFIWRGDILMPYAVGGLLALLFLRMQARNLIVAGLLGYLLGGLAYLAAYVSPSLVADTEFGDQPEFAEMRSELDRAQSEMLAEDAVETAIMTQGSYADFVAHNVGEHIADPFADSAMMLLFETVPLILIGMGLYRSGFFSGGLNRRKQLFWGWTGIVVGSLVTLVAAWALTRGGLTFWESIAAFMAYAHYPKLLVIFGLAAVLAIYGANASGWLAERLTAAGRAAFTNYLGTSVLMMLIFHPWAGGLWGELSRAELYLVVALGWAVMLWWSKPWLERYRYGPLEWLWRCLTYGKLFPWKR
ncbi:DUF418 domain-containing protein [Erythrobacter sp. EC-HK427]|uniref:DUF418 domain-containing protein n=1 Tax=Erythrobacter sp. EC-HK427 TaxID=2038396 RepID=UPI001257FB08|nr:DUF418 domain-containing protein [Erythrobacter sp. EC-HK427]VVS98447.1 conserved membrane hypothetical protein [Erythrobacter sp. EC-HK427]